MKYEVMFRVPQEDSGLATFIAKQIPCSTAPYQYERPNDYRAQNFIFYNLSSVITFLNKAYEKLGDRFILEYIKEFDNKIA